MKGKAINPFQPQKKPTTKSMSLLVIGKPANPALSPPPLTPQIMYMADLHAVILLFLFAYYCCTL